MARLILLFALLGTPAEAARLLCLGTGPGFMAVLEGATATLDYLGDGTYGLDPPLAEAFDFAGHSLITQRDRWDLYLERRGCRVAGATLPVSIEIAVPTSAGLRPLQGCCTWNDR